MICYGNNCNSGSIHRCLQEVAPPKDPGFDPPAGKRPERVDRQPRQGKDTPVICVETGRAYASMAAAARETFTNANRLSLVVGHPDKTAGGFHWVFA